MNRDLPLVVPAEVAWLPLVEALTWIRFSCAVELDELLHTKLVELDLTAEELRMQLEQAWRALADEAGAADISIRGRRDGEREERELGIQDLRNCSFLTWSGVGEDSRPHWDTSNSRYVVRVERYKDDFEGNFARIGDKTGHDYWYVVVSRAGLMVRYPVPGAIDRRIRTVGATLNDAVEWLKCELDLSLTGAQPKAYFIERMRDRFSISASLATRAWAQAVADRPGWSKPGRKQKFKSNKKIES